MRYPELRRLQRYVSRIQFRYLLSAVAVVCLLSIPVSTIVMRQLGVATGPGFGDFSAYWLAVDRWQHGISLYAHEDFGFVQEQDLFGFFPYLYPPVPVLLFSIYQIVPFTVAATLWGVTTSGSLWLATVILLEEYYPMTWPRRILVGPLIFFFQPVWYAFNLGQITPLLAALVTLSGVAMERARSGSDSVWIGFGVSAAAFVKPIVLPAGAVLLPSRRRLIGGALTVGSLIGIGVLVFGFQNHIRYIDVILHAKSGSATTLQSVNFYHAGWYEPFDILGVWSWLPRILLLLVVAGLSFWRMDTLNADRAAFAAGVAVIPLTAPEGYSLSFVFLIPAIIVLIAARPRWWPWLTLALVVSHWQPWTMYYLGNTRIETEVAVFLQPGLYANLFILGSALYLLWQSRQRLSLPDLWQ